METEILNKKAKGLHFRSDEKFSPGHRCKDQTLQVLTVCDDEEHGREEDVKGGNTEEEHLHLDMVEVSLNS